MSRSRYYPGRVRPRGYKRDWHAPLQEKRDHDLAHELSMLEVDGYTEFADTWDQDRDVLDYSWTSRHAAEARFRNHRTRGARKRDKKGTLSRQHRNALSFAQTKIMQGYTANLHLRKCGCCWTVIFMNGIHYSSHVFFSSSCM